MPSPVEKNLIINSEDYQIIKTIEDGEHYISSDIAAWLQGQEFEDKRDLIQRGLRYSPESIRCLLFYMRIGYIFEGDNAFYKRVPNDKLFVANADVYGVINGFYSHEEYKAINQGGVLTDHFPKEYQDLDQKSDKIFSSAKEVANKIVEMKEKDPDVKSVLFHGKWNGVPHAGHMLYLNRSLDKIVHELGVNPNKVVAIVGCDGNRYIKETRHPFLDTDWRMSLMSYLPLVNMVFFPGDFTTKQAGKAWTDIYKIIKPDFVPIEAKDKYAENRFNRATISGSTPILVDDYINLDDKVENRISMSELLNGETNMENFKKTNQLLLNLTGLSWQRDWFEKEV
jgi:hypothetical protein